MIGKERRSDPLIVHNAMKEASSMSITSPNGTPIGVRPRIPEELDRIVLRCWPGDRNIFDRLFAKQGN